MTVARADGRALVALLDTERRLLRDGRYDELAALQDEKERLMASLDGARLDPAGVARLQTRAAANLTLLAAAREGIAAAQARLRELERLVRGAGGYDRRGARVGGSADPRTSRRV